MFLKGTSAVACVGVDSVSDIVSHYLNIIE